ncbi:MAG: HEAT repeat domain-containing protein [Treponema sp.]|nr:HEAT repeat domain-containing protein [Treponema sp.]
MKRTVLFLIFLFCFPLFCQAEASEIGVLVEDNNEIFEAPEINSSQNEISEEQGEKTVQASKGGYAEVPPAKKPRSIDQEKAKSAAAKDENNEEEENIRMTIKYGIPSEISEKLDDLIKNEDPRFTEEIYDLFQVSKNSTIKEKILKYFTKAEDPCLEDFAVNLLNDPYDEKNELVKATFQYISAVKTKAAVPAVINLIESENENYFNDAISTLGDIGGASEAVYLVEFLEREDLTDAQRQILMRTCGKMHAVETWDKLVDILEDDEENAFVRMYAAESLGLMKVDKSVPVLVRNFDATDPNLRQYVIKGLENFPDVVEAKATILQAIRDEHWKVRQEAIKAVKEMEIKEAVPYLIYRAKNDSEKVIKEESITSIAKLNSQEGNDYLVKQITDKKVGDATKKKIIQELLKVNTVGEDEILELAKDCCNDDKKKDLRYAIGKELTKYDRSKYAEVCSLYLSSKDTTTIGIGLDMFKMGKYPSCEPQVHTLATDKKANTGLRARAKKMLNIEDEESADAKNSDSKKADEK